MIRSANRSPADEQWRAHVEESVALGLFVVGVALLLTGAIGAVVQILGP